MKKHELLQIMDAELLDKLFGFCYARTNDSYEAQELCSDIIYELVKVANTDGDINNLYPFIWRVARNVYADFSEKKRHRADMLYEEDSDAVLAQITVDEQEDIGEELLESIYHRIAFLTKAYREVMIMFYIDGLSTAEIAIRQNTSETAVRQRLFSARKKIRSEVEEMAEICDKPVVLDKMDYVLWGTGKVSWDDPRELCTRQFSKHVMWLCCKKPMSATEIATKLNVPTVYVEEELEILTNGQKGKYGLLRRLDNGKYVLNFILLDKDEMEKANAIYTEHLPIIARTIIDYIEKHKEEYLAFPYINKKVDLNLILWQQIYAISDAFSKNVERILSEKYFAQTGKIDRPFHVFGYVDNGKNYGCGWDGVNAENVCGYSKIRLDNIYITRIKQHFDCGLYVARNPQIQLALRAINGLDINTFSEVEKEHAAKAIECGYLYREGEMVYTKLLVSDIKDADRLYDISNRLSEGYFEKEAEIVAGKIAALIHKIVPEYLHEEWKNANYLACTPVLDSLVEILIENGVLIPPKDGIGAEGCWMSVG